ncbi:MAG: ABC transporter ATP-binding protein [Chloroflexi bacterium]|nr:ABC transporter ATP-binding protein [Chloroflexota bacterium]
MTETLTNKRYSVLAVVAILTSSIMLPAQIWISKIVVDSIVQELGYSSTQASSGWLTLIIPVSFYIIIWIFGTICQSLQENIKEILVIQVENHVKYLILHKASSLSISFFETPDFYDKMNNAQREVYRVSNVTFQIFEVFQLGASLIASLIILARVSIWIPLILLIATFPQAITRSHFTNMRYSLYLSRSTAERMNGYVTWLLTTREAIKEIRLFQLQNHFLKLFLQSAQEYLKKIQQIIGVEVRINSGLSIFALLGTLGVWILAILKTLSKSITIGDLVLTFQAAELCQTTLGESLKWSGVLLENSLYLQILFDFLDLQPDAVEGALSPMIRDGEPGRVALPKEKSIEFRNVSFRYPRTSNWAVENISFSLKPGEKVALVGENGAGKTTIVKLLARLYDPTAGDILMNGINIREIDQKEYYSFLGIIFQDFVRYDLSVKENIGMGQIDCLNDLERITLAAKKSGAEKMIKKLPHGLDTVLGKTFEDGVDLSGGEWQKIALSRAFMRDTSILILDEPTSSLDARAEYEIFRKFGELSGGKMTIVISHRLSSAKMVDRILYLKNGRLIEQGTHADLLALRGEYFNLYNIQAERYR